MLRDAPPDGARDTAALTLLSTGFERLIRSALAAAWTKDHGRLPDIAEFGRLGLLSHDILAMWQRLSRVGPSVPSGVSAVLEASAEPGSPEHRLLELLTAQAQPLGRYAQQRAYLGSRDRAVIPPRYSSQMLSCGCGSEGGLTPILTGSRAHRTTTARHARMPSRSCVNWRRPWRRYSIRACWGPSAGSSLSSCHRCAD